MLRNNKLTFNISSNSSSSSMRLNMFSSKSCNISNTSSSNSSSSSSSNNSSRLQNLRNLLNHQRKMNLLAKKRSACLKKRLGNGSLSNQSDMETSASLVT